MGSECATKTLAILAATDGVTRAGINARTHPKGPCKGVAVEYDGSSSIRGRTMRGEKGCSVKIRTSRFFRLRLPERGSRPPDRPCVPSSDDVRAAPVPKTYAILGQGCDVPAIVRHQNERNPRLIPQPLQIGLQGVAPLDVQTGERLVEEEDPRVHAERACNGDATRFAAGEGLRPTATKACQVHQLERRLDRHRARRVTRPKGKIIGDGEVGKQSPILEDEADPATMGGRRKAGVRINDDIIVDLKSNRHRRRKAGERKQKGRLARSGRAFDGERARLAPSAEVEAEGVSAGADVESDHSAPRPF